MLILYHRWVCTPLSNMYFTVKCIHISWSMLIIYKIIRSICFFSSILLCRQLWWSTQTMCSKCWTGQRTGRLVDNILFPLPRIHHIQVVLQVGLLTIFCFPCPVSIIFMWFDMFLQNIVLFNTQRAFIWNWFWPRATMLTLYYNEMSRMVRSQT